MRMTHRLVVAVAAFLASACSGTEAPSSLPTTPGNERLILTLSAQTDTIPESTSKLLTARITDLTGFVRPGTVTWKSDNPSVATVSNGLVTGIALGVTSVIASTPGAADTARIVVTENGVVLDVQPSDVEILAGDTIDFVATLRTRSGDVVPVGSFAWTASDTSSASFVDAGVLHAKQEAEISVSAEAMRRVGTSTVRIFRAPVASVTLTPTTASIYKGESVQLVAKPRDWAGRLLERDVHWGSSDPSKATVDDNGLVKGVGTGTVVITATVETKTASAAINVMAPAATTVVLELPATTLNVGTEMQATTTVSDGSGEPLTGKTVAYQSSSPSVATVTSAGVVRGITEGSVTISAIADGIVSRRGLTVRGGTPTTVRISPEAPSVMFGQQSQLVAMVFDEIGNLMPNRPITWSSSNPAAISVSSTGLIQGVGAGSSVITARNGDLSAAVTATVTNAPVASVRVSPSSVSLVAGKQQTVSAEALDANGSILVGRVVTWASQNPVVATVTNAGVVTAVATGSTSLVATIEGKTANLPITVSAAPLAPVAAVTVTLGSATLSVGQSTQAVAALTDQSGNTLTGRAVQWTSLDPTVATVTASGAVTAVAGGTVAIVASSEGKSGSASLTVNAPSAAPVARVTLSVPTADLGVGQQVQAEVTLYDAAGNVLVGRTISYRTDNSMVLTVSGSGLIKGMGSGSTKMHVTSGGVSTAETFRVSGEATAPVVASISVAPSTSTLSVGQTVQAVATAKDAQGTTVSGTAFTWTTSNAAVATVSSSGLVNAVSAGSAVIHAAGSGVTGSMSVTVTAPPTSSSTVASVTVALSPSSILVGGTSQATAVARNASGVIISGKTPTWSLGASLLGSVTSSGVVSGLQAGSLPVTATIDGVSGSASLTISLAPTTPPPTSANVELPRQYLNFPYPAKTGATILVNQGDNLQTALNNAKRGDEIVLAAGATFSGNFILPAKTGNASNGWIVIRSSKSDQLPPIGSRVGAQHAPLMARIQSPNQSAAIQTATAASGWRLVGIEVTISSLVTAQNFGLVSLGNVGSSQSTLAQVPSDFVLDRMYIHGQSNSNLSRCVVLNSARTEVSDSYITECHGKGFDSQAILGWNGPGPFKIVNNMLAGAGENIMFGGGDPSIPNLVPADIEIRRNYIYKPITWKGIWTIKNLLETKNAVRVLIEGNVLDGSWADAQGGMAVLFRSSNQGGACRWCRTTDVTMRRNLIRNAGGGIGFVGGDFNPQDTTARRILVSENVIEGLNVSPYLGANARAFMITDVSSVTIERTIARGTLYQGMWTDRLLPSPGVVLRDVALPRGQYGIGADGLTEGEPGLKVGIPGFVWTNITIFGSAVSTYPSGTTFSQAEPSWAATVRSIVSSATAGVDIP